MGDRPRELRSCEYPSTCFFNDEWVTETSDEGRQQRARDLRAVIDEMKAAGVHHYSGGIDSDAPVFHVEPNGDRPDLPPFARRLPVQFHPRRIPAGLAHFGEA